MTKVGVSGAAGRMGTLACAAIEEAEGLELAARYSPGRGFDDPGVMAGCDVILELTRPDVVMANAALWRGLDAHCVIGTSGFDEARIEELREIWGEGPPNCLVVPNFSLGATLLLRLAEEAGPYFRAAEVVEMHHDQKADAPSGTALAAAARLAPHGTRATESTESIAGARGAGMGEVRVHSVRLPGVLARHEVLLGNPGEVLTIRHDTLDRSAFIPGILLALSGVAGLPGGVTVGLEAVL
ncbi:MAG TPA: 4-hydroxy-tetrahydrodipicolinate reductase [Acidimicrobiia bacterium]